MPPPRATPRVAPSPFSHAATPRPSMPPCRRCRLSATTCLRQALPAAAPTSSALQARWRCATEYAHLLRCSSSRASAASTPGKYARRRSVRTMTKTVLPNARHACRHQESATKCPCPARIARMIGARSVTPMEHATGPPPRDAACLYAAQRTRLIRR